MDRLLPFCYDFCTVHLRDVPFDLFWVATWYVPSRPFEGSVQGKSQSQKRWKLWTFLSMGSISVYSSDGEPVKLPITCFRYCTVCSSHRSVSTPQPPTAPSLKILRPSSLSYIQRNVEALYVPAVCRPFWITLFKVPPHISW